MRPFAEKLLCRARTVSGDHRMAQVLTVAWSCQLRSTISEQPARICSFGNTEVSVHRHREASCTRKRNLRALLPPDFPPLWPREAGMSCQWLSGSSVSEPNLPRRRAFAFHSPHKGGNHAIEQTSERVRLELQQTGFGFFRLSLCRGGTWL